MPRMTKAPAAGGGDPLELLLRRASRAFGSELAARLRARGYGDIRRSHGAVFANIDDEGTHPSELALRAGMTRPSMTELIADLATKGYVTRRAEEGDARSRIVVLTRRGIKHREEARTIIAEMERLYRKRLGPQRMACLRDALGRISTFAEPGA